LCAASRSARRSLAPADRRQREPVPSLFRSISTRGEVGGQTID
jgi:hypothetical protein